MLDAYKTAYIIKPRSIVKNKIYKKFQISCIHFNIPKNLKKRKKQKSA